MISIAEFKKWPPWIGRKELLQLGFSQAFIEFARMPLPTDGSSVPVGKIAYLRMSRTYGKYRRSDVASLLGPLWQ